MKKRNTTSKIAVGTLSIASLIAPSSCESNQEMEEKLQVNNYDIHTALSITHTFTKEEMDYIHFIHNLIGEITQNQNIAHQFAKNPTEYMEQQGYKAGNIFNANSKYMKLIIALGDLDVRQKLDNKDLNGFFTLCKEKGYAENYSGNLLKCISSNNLSNNKYANLANTRSYQAQDEVQCVIPIVVWAVVVAAEWYYLIHVYKTAAWTQGKSFTSSSISDQPYVNIALLNEDEKTAYMICDKYIEQEISIIVETVKKENPELTDVQLLELTNFLKKNIIQLNDIITNEKE